MLNFYVLGTKIACIPTKIDECLTLNMPYTSQLSNSSPAVPLSLEMPVSLTIDCIRSRIKVLHARFGMQDDYNCPQGAIKLPNGPTVACKVKSITQEIKYL